jgi:hypothetical protein
MAVTSIHNQTDYSSSGVSSNKDDEKSPVAIPCTGYEEMKVHWELIHDLCGGTLRMREAGTKWLPQESAEDITAYDNRLNRAILFNGFNDTLNKLTNRPFIHPILITDMPEELIYLLDDVDGNKKSLETFCKEVLKNLIKYGIAYIFVSHSRLEDVENGKELTIAEEKSLGARIYLINISPADLIGWQTEKIGDKLELAQIRVKETATEANGDYGDIAINYINVYGKDAYEIHQQDDDKQDKYNKIEEGSSTLGSIPLVSIYANRTGFMTADPPLEDLAWLNLAHWQSYADQRNILHFTRFGLLFGKGLPQEMVEAGSLQVGPTKAYLVEPAEADLKYVEHNGKSIDAGKNDVEDIEQKMRVLGNQPLIKNIPSTATSERIDEDRTVSQLQSWVHALQKGIKEAIKTACDWRKIIPKDTFDIQIYSDFEAFVLGGGDKQLLLDTRKIGEITRERFLKELQRRGVFSQEMNAEEEAKAADEEGNKDLKDFLPEENNTEEEMEEEEDE